MGKYVNKPLWTSIDYVKQHSKLCHDCEDAEIELWIVSAEQTILEILNRDYDSLIEKYGDIPGPVREATLMLVDNSYSHRGVTEQVQLYPVLYGLEMKLKPFMIL